MIDDVLAELEADTSVDIGTQFAALTARYLDATRRGEGQVSTPRPPEELARRFDEEIPRTGRSTEEVLARLERDVIADANKYCHPMYMGHQTSAPLAVGIWMESVISALNQSLAVQEMSPTATMIEHRLIRWWEDPHKGMLLPLAAGMVIARHERDLDGAFAQQAPYLFSDRDAPVKGDEAADARVLDQGVRSFQCSRRADVLKVWFAIQRYGATGLGRIYDHLCATARLLYDAIEERPDFENLHEPESNILCFLYRGRPAGRSGHPIGSERERIDAINRELRQRYNRDGTGWITATVLDGRPVLRVTMMNPRTGAAHVRALLDGLVAQARKIEENGGQ